MKTVLLCSRDMLQHLAAVAPHQKLALPVTALDADGSTTQLSMIVEGANDGENVRILDIVPFEGAPDLEPRAEGSEVHAEPNSEPHEPVPDAKEPPACPSFVEFIAAGYKAAIYPPSWCTPAAPEEIEKRDAFIAACVHSWQPITIGETVDKGVVGRCGVCGTLQHASPDPVTSGAAPADPPPVTIDAPPVADIAKTDAPPAQSDTTLDSAFDLSDDSEPPPAAS